MWEKIKARVTLKSSYFNWYASAGIKKKKTPLEIVLEILPIYIILLLR